MWIMAEPQPGILQLYRAVLGSSTVILCLAALKLQCKIIFPSICQLRAQGAGYFLTT